MFELKTISIANFYLNDAVDVEVHGSTALIGPTGAGKSSLIDVIQTVHSGNNRRFLELNPAAGITKTRSVKSYIEGSVSDVNEGKPRRKNCESTLALTYYDKNKNEFLTLALFFKISDAPDETTKRYVIRNCDFKIADFVDGKGANKSFKSHKAILDSLKENAEVEIDSFPTAKKYVEAYLKIARPKGTPDVYHYLRGLSNALKTRELTNPTDFVRNFLLLPAPIDIQSVKDKIILWRDIRTELTRLEKMGADIQTVNEVYNRNFKISIAHDINAYQIEAENYAKYEQELDSEKSKLSKEEFTLVETTKAFQHTENNLKDKIKRAEEIETEKSNLSDRTTLEKKRNNTILNREHAQNECFNHIQEFTNIKVSNQAIKDIQEEVSKISSTDLRSAATLIQNSISIAEKEIQFHHTSAQMQSLRHKEAELEELQAHINNNPDTKILYSRKVIEFQRILDANNIEYTNLPEVIKIKRPEWVFAIESLLGTNKEIFIIEPEFEKRAFDLLHENRGSLDYCRILNTANLRDVTHTADNSLVSEIQFADSRAAKFVTGIIGRYQKALRIEDLHNHQYAIMMDGRTTGGAVKRVFRHRDQVLTVSNSNTNNFKSKLASLQSEIETLTREVHRTNDVSDLKQIQFFAIGTLNRSITSLEAINKQIENLEEIFIAASSDDKTRLSKLNEELDVVNENISTLENERLTLIQQRDKTNKTIGIIEERTGASRKTYEHKQT